MKLYVCSGGSTDIPGPVDVHPCAKAIHALDRAGIEYERVTVGGKRMLPWTLRGPARDEIERLSGQRLVPILVLDDGKVINGGGAIAAWARSQATG